MKQRKPPIPSAQRKAVAKAQPLPAATAEISTEIAAAITLHRQGKLDQAAAIYADILRIRPLHFDAMQMLGTIATQRGKFAEAIELFDRALALNPNIVQALTNRGTALRNLNRPEEALASFERALQLSPNNPVTLYNLGSVLSDLKQHSSALKSYDRAISIKPDYFVAHNNRGNALLALNRYQEAIESYTNALKLNPEAGDVLCNRGNALRALGRYDESLASYDLALKIKPDYVAALCGRGNSLAFLKRHVEALGSYNRAIALQPNYVDAINNRANTLREMKRHEEALTDYELAIKIKPDHELLLASRLYARLKLCDWRDVDSQIATLAEKIERGDNTSPPFPFLSISNSPALQKKVATKWTEGNHPTVTVPAPLAKLPKHGRIRVGYFSADFRDHPGSYLMAGLFEAHDRSKFELTAFSFGPATQDEMQKRVAAAFDSFIDVREMTDPEVVSLARRLEIDIAIDRKGFTQGCRPGIFALRAAPIQVSYLAYPGTMGADYIDYIVADSVVIPEHDRIHYSEKVAYLPDSYQVNDSKRRIANKAFTRAELGLPDSGFVFCCFNNNYKIMPATFDSWMRILKRVEGSVLWLYEDNATATRNLRREAESRGVSGSRLVVAPRMPLAEHLARHRAADLFLDTLPYNAHTTASDALWAGLPVLTCLGDTFAARVAASLLHAIRLPELITTTPEAFEALAIELATNPKMLSGIRQKLADNRLSAPLFDTELFTHNLEALYTKMYERYQANLEPDHLYGNQSGNRVQTVLTPQAVVAKSVDAKFKIAFALHQAGQLDQAESIFNEILQSQPKHCVAMHFVATIAVQRGNALLAVELFDQIIKLKPDYVDAFINRGNALHQLMRYEDALESYGLALMLAPKNAHALNNRGIALSAMNRHEESLSCYATALEINPDFADALNNRANSLRKLKRFEQAVKDYGRVLQIQPDRLDAMKALGSTLLDMNRYTEGLTVFGRVLKIQPDYEYLLGIWLLAKMRICEWHDPDHQFDELLKLAEHTKRRSPPFALLAISNSRSQQRRAAEDWIASKHPPADADFFATPLPRRAKIRIGYFSADFHNHATAYLIAELFERHDKSKFELIGFSFGQLTRDVMRTRLANAFDEFIDVLGMSDIEVAKLARNRSIDIAIDLKGITQYSRTGIFAARAAPIQVNYLGYPGTMGAKYIDYLIADPTLIPESHQSDYTEKIAYLPHSYQVNDSKRRIANREFTRGEMGLPESGFVFCCFNNSFKILPHIFDGWMRILKQVEHSVLWLFEDNAKAASNLRHEAELRGINPARIVFAERLPLAEHLARHRLADLFLDTLPYNAHTTASDALWAGLPVLTCLGETFAARVAASLLNAIQLPELITTTQMEYEALAIELATNPKKMKIIKQKLVDNRLTTPLFDTGLFTRNLEALYTKMYLRHQANLTPDHLNLIDR